MYTMGDDVGGVLEKVEQRSAQHEVVTPSRVAGKVKGEG